MCYVAVHQPNFLPWMGYLAKIARADYFIFLDNVQFSKGSFTNRSKILDGGHPNWLTVPAKPRLGTPITEVKIASFEWKQKHLEKIEMNYQNSPNSGSMLPFLRKLYDQDDLTMLSAFNIHLIKAISELLELKVTFIRSSEITTELFASPTDRIVALIKEVGGTHYISGNGARSYQDLRLFSEQSINVQYLDFIEKPYKQNAPKFHKGLSCIDSLFNIGIDDTRRNLFEKKSK